MKALFESSAMLDRGGKAKMRELLSSMVFNPVDGTIRLNGDRLVMQRSAVGAELHMFSGVVRVETVHNDFDFRKKRFAGEFLWHDSVEALDSRPHHATPAPACWTQTGYASGYATHVFRHADCVYKEIACAAQGHKHCRVVGKPAEARGSS